MERRLETARTGCRKEPVLQIHILRRDDRSSAKALSRHSLRHEQTIKQMKITEISHDIVSNNEGILRTHTFRWILNHLIPPGTGNRLVDLGAGPCIFSKICNAKGYVVTAIDGRTERVPSDLGKIEFIHSDVRDVDLGRFDIVLIIGLFYHLTLADQIALLNKCIDRLVIMDTQVHISEHVVEKNSISHGNFADNVTTSPEGYEGVLFPEAENPMASIGNSTSWWHSEASMKAIFKNSGFRELSILNPPYISKYGARRWYVAR